MACKSSWRNIIHQILTRDTIAKQGGIVTITHLYSISEREYNLLRNTITTPLTNKESSKPTLLNEKLKTGVCPICFTKPIIFSKHHIIPKSQYGTDDYKNIINVCKHCHDILEEYADNGIYYSPELARIIRLLLIY